MMSGTGLKLSEWARAPRVEPELTLLEDALGGIRLYPAEPACGVDFHAAQAIGYAPSRTPLTGRQLAVARMVALGLADKEIALFLRMSHGTVKSTVSLILRRLNLHRRTQICRYVYEMNLLSQG